jgi:beta-lactamase class A
MALVLGIALGSAGMLSIGGFLSANLGALPLCGRSYPLINPWLRCEPEQNLLKKKEFSDFRVGLEKKIDGWKAQGRVSHVSVYLRDLQFGPWMGINEQESYSAASLLKVPVMFAVLKKAERNPAILGQRVKITAEIIDHSFQEFSPAHKVVVGKVYTVDELLYFMIAYSDNNAKNALGVYLQLLSPEESLIEQTMEELGLVGLYRTLSDEVTIKQAASLFRILYNASYLSKDKSEKALELLSESAFTDGIASGLPSDITIAHKFGERENEDGVKQLHDCGVVYHPDGHYLLCIMTRGSNEKELATVIADISREIATEIKSRRQEI